MHHQLLEIQILIPWNWCAHKNTENILFLESKAADGHRETGLIFAPRSLSAACLRAAQPNQTLLNPEASHQGPISFLKKQNRSFVRPAPKILWRH